MPDTIQILENLTVTAFDAGTVVSGTPSGKMVKEFTTPIPFISAVGMLA